MKLAFSIPEQLYWIHDFLPVDLYTKIHKVCIKQKKNINLHSKWTKSWPTYTIDNIIKPPKSTGFNQLESVIPASRDLWQDLKTRVKHNPYRPIKELTFSSSLIYMMEKNSGIQWHDDYPKKSRFLDRNANLNLKNMQNYWGTRSDWKYAASLYLNHRWDDTWGGELMYTDSKTRGYIPIVGNSLVLMRTPLQHKVNTVLSPVLPRVSIQMFLR